MQDKHFQRQTLNKRKAEDRIHQVKTAKNAIVKSSDLKLTLRTKSKVHPTTNTNLYRNGLKYQPTKLEI